LVDNLWDFDICHVYIEKVNSLFLINSKYFHHIR